ncbi:helix-turn-helix domain-containing protein [Actinacidiphila sp. bgisy160]|uniref:helix-turn-helix domain-containing protein n=1 Tax=Actinacidiphila sp. bgisy160 TaxID=3413796 RepID=UPI003D7260F6
MRRISVTTAVRVAALAAAMFISFAVERDLALSHGVPTVVAPAVPVAVDLFMVWAVRTRRDVALSVAVAVAANVAGVLTVEPLAAVDTWVSAGLHAVFPLTVWRMHRRHAPAADPLTTQDAPADRPAAPVPDTPPVAQQATRPDTVTNRPKATPAERRPAAPAADMSAVRDAVRELAATGQRVTGRMLADRLGVSERTARRYLAAVA